MELHSPARTKQQSNSIFEVSFHEWDRSNQFPASTAIAGVDSRKSGIVKILSKATVKPWW
jgi:hypothetical protein